ncbi:MAG: hypothetical protein DWQ08_12620 [Proteobacteria bacterium]|nr:MAG: hypothetical protein DWQ08_12620 [Pseudomonadota bacterium]
MRSLPAISGVIAEGPGEEAASSRDNPIIDNPADEIRRLRSRTAKVTGAWIESMGEAGQSLYDSAN